MRTTSASPQIAPLIMRLHAALAEVLFERLPEAGFPDIRPTHCQVLRGIEPGGSRLTVWRLARGSASWRQVQVLHVPVAYGSSS